MKKSDQEKIMKHIKKNKIPIIAGAILILIIVFFVIPFPYKVAESYSEQEPYTTTERYTDWVNAKNCDRDSNCACKHKSWLGLGSCDSCECYRERSVTKYKTVSKTRTVTKKASIFTILTG